MDFELVIHPRAQKEYEKKLHRLSLRPFTTHTVRDFIEEMEDALQKIKLSTNTSQARRALGTRLDIYRVGPTKIFSYSVIYKVKDCKIYVVAFAAPEQRPVYWARRKF